MIDFKSNLDVKTPKEIFAEINERFIGAVMMHGQFADYFDFLGLKGFKRMHEYQHIAESLERRKVCQIGFQVSVVKELIFPMQITPEFHILHKGQLFRPEIRF